MTEPEQEMEIAHMLCLRIVEFASLPLNEQTGTLQDLVSGDGMSLAFIGSPAVFVSLVE